MQVNDVHQATPRSIHLDLPSRCHLDDAGRRAQPHVCQQRSGERRQGVAPPRLPRCRNRCPRRRHLCPEARPAAYRCCARTRASGSQGVSGQPLRWAALRRCPSDLCQADAFKNNKDVQKRKHAIMRCWSGLLDSSAAASAFLAFQRILLLLHYGPARTETTSGPGLCGCANLWFSLLSMLGHWLSSLEICLVP